MSFQDDIEDEPFEPFELPEHLGSTPLPNSPPQHAVTKREALRYVGADRARLELLRETTPTAGPARRGQP